MSGDAGAVRINGRSYPLDRVPDSERLLDSLRWRLGLRGTKEGCRSGACGACTVLVDGRPWLSCLVLTRELSGTEVRSIEGLESDPVARRVRQAFDRTGALQCGYCTPGFVVALVGALRGTRGGRSARSLLEGLDGNLCRCTGYAAIVRAVQRLAAGEP